MSTPTASRRLAMRFAGHPLVARVRAHPRVDRLLRILAVVLPSGAVALSIVTFAGYAMGLLRDKALAHTYGAGSQLDAYNAAFVLPELFLDVLVAGGLVAPFVPVFVGLRDEAEEDARAFGRTVFTLAILVMVAACGLLFVFAPQTADLIVPRYTGDQRDLYIGLFRVMLVTPVLFAASLVLGEILVAEGRLLLYGLAPLMYSGGIFAGALLLGGDDRLGIYGAAVGAVVGALLHLAIRMVGIYRTRFRPRPSLALRTRGLGQFLRLMAPKSISQPIEPLTFAYFSRLASSISAGSLTAYNFGRNFQGMPVNFIGMSFALAAFPHLSESALRGDRRGFLRIFATNLATIFVLSTAAAVGLFLLGGFVIDRFLGGGRFDAEDVRMTTMVLSIYTLSIPLEAVGHLLARALYATQNTILPTCAALAGFVVMVASASVLMGPIGLAAIPASYSIAMAVRVLLLGIALVPQVARIGATETLVTETVRTGRPPRGRQPERRPRRWAQLALGGLMVALLAGTLYAGSIAMDGATLAAQPEVTAWARERAAASVVVPTIQPTPPPTPAPPPSPEPTATLATTASPSATPSPSPTPSPTPTPGPFAMDLFEKGDFVEEAYDTWCVPAAMQTSMNIMDAGADTTKATQTRLWNLARAIAPGKEGGAEPEGWAKGLAQLGYGNYQVTAKPTLDAAVKLVVKQIRLTNRPAGLMVWRGWHSWVVSGFKATADPAVTDAFKVTALYIEDVWYDRVSSLWSQDRGGHSRPPDSLVPVNVIGVDFLPWHQKYSYPGKDGQYVVVLPTM